MYIESFSGTKIRKGTKTDSFGQTLYSIDNFGNKIAQEYVYLTRSYKKYLESKYTKEDLFELEVLRSKIERQVKEFGEPDKIDLQEYTHKLKEYTTYQEYINKPKLYKPRHDTPVKRNIDKSKITKANAAPNPYDSPEVQRQLKLILNMLK